MTNDMQQPTSDQLTISEDHDLPLRTTYEVDSNLFKNDCLKILIFTSIV